MVETSRKKIIHLTDREYALYRAICGELDDLQRSIRRENYGGLDVSELAVAMRDRMAPGVELEASGGVNLKTIAAIAKSGVDRISVGALTHSAPIVDLGLDFEDAKR